MGAVMCRDRCASALIVVCIATGLLAISSTSTGETRQIKIKGYVTNVTSPTQFEIEDYRITRDTTFALEFDNATPELHYRPEDIKVGVELEIKGTLDESTGTLHATTIKVDLEQFKRAKYTAIITYPPVRVTRDGTGWSGRFVADGQRIEVTPTTQVLFKLTSREQKLAKAAAKTTDENDDTAFEPLRSLDQVTAGMVMSYEGPRDFDGTIRAEKVTFSRNDLENGEAKMWNSIVPEVKAFAGTKPPELKISGVGKFKLIADEEVQTYVTKIGQSLIPDHQRVLASDDPRRLNFRFYVVDDKEPNAFALPNGIFVIKAGMFGLLENEAQLASVVGHEIAHATQEHTWRQMQFHKKKRMGLMIAAAVAQAYGKYNLADVFTLTQAAIQTRHSCGNVSVHSATGLRCGCRTARPTRRVMGLRSSVSFECHRDDHEIELLQRRVVQIQCPIIEDVHFGAFPQPNLRELALHSVDLATLLAAHKLNRSA
jgi:hypothetical protein